MVAKKPKCCCDEHLKLKPSDYPKGHGAFLKDHKSNWVCYGCPLHKPKKEPTMSLAEQDGRAMARTLNRMTDRFYNRNTQENFLRGLYAELYKRPTGRKK
jgi:hypothetical protein